MSTSQRSAVRTHTIPVNLTYPEAIDKHLRVTAGACRMLLSPDTGSSWVTGTYADPSDLAPLRIVPEGGTVRLVAGDSPAVALSLLSGVPTLDLKLGTAQPFDLTVHLGGGDCTLDLGGVPVTRLEAKQGAGQVKLDFSSPHPVEMRLLTLGTGAGNVEVSHLGNANCGEMIFEGGAAAYLLDFTGGMQRETHVRVATGVSSVEIRVPVTTAVRLASESLLCAVDLDHGWSKHEGAYWNQAGLAGGRPVLRITASVALGSLRLRNAR
jgi:hypothetical protein